MRATTKFGVCLATCALGAALAVESAAQGIKWIRAPSAAELDAAYPEAAKIQGVGGHAWVSCKLVRNGALEDCRNVGESPEGYGFGENALRLVSNMQAEPFENGHESLGITLPIHFGPPTPDRPVRATAFRSVTKDRRFRITDARFRKLAPVGPYWPDNALRQGLGGFAAVDCKVTSAGELADCIVVGEQTSHPMFGDSILAMARQGWMYAGPAPENATSPDDGIWRFEVVFPRRTLADAR